MIRLLIGLLAIGSLVTGLVLAWISPQDWLQPIGPASLRLSLLLGVLWLAAPDLQRMPLWIVGVVVATVIALVFFARHAKAYIPLIAGVALLLLFLRPRPPRKKPGGVRVSPQRR